MAKCEMCDKESVIEQPMINSPDGKTLVCLNCGWFISKNYLDEEELDNWKAIMKEQKEGD